MNAPVWPCLRPAVIRLMMIQVNRAWGHFLAYLGWTAAFRLLALTLVTYFLMSSNSRFQDISDAYGSNEIALMGVSAFLYLLLARRINPVGAASLEEIFTPARFEKKFVPGFLQGSGLALGVVSAFLLSGFYRFLGFYIQFEEAALTLSNILVRILCLGVLVYCEEFIFRQKILNLLRKKIPDIYAIVVTAAAYCVIKALQFDLGLMQLTTLFLIAMLLGVRAVTDSDFVQGAGVWAALLIVFHPLLSLPIFGNDFQGILLVKYQSGYDLANETTRFLTGGIGGPLSSFALQLALLLDLVRRTLRNKRILLNPS